ncbi:MAG: N-formylglutamate amidohydrolase, partial [Gammaproteobacteria bacterium]
MSDVRNRLLDPDEPAPVERVRHTSRSPFVLTCEHAGKVIPKRLGQLGLAAPDLERHIAYD